MKLSYLLAPLLALSIGASPALAASSTNAGNVRDIATTKDGWATFNHTGFRWDTVGCQNPSQPKAWSINTTTPAGQAQIAMLFTAYVQNKQVVIVGTNGCNPSGFEEVSYLYFLDPA